MLGKLTINSVPWDVPIVMVTGACIVVVAALVLLGITYFGKWGYLWKEWLTSVDHKRIGVMYIVLALVMLVRGFADAIMMRLQLAWAYNSPGYLPPHHYDQIFTAHGTIMIFFMAMPFMTGLMNITVPLQIGARDVAFPTLNSISFWLTTVSAMLVNVSLLVGEFAKTGWLAYPPLSEVAYSPDVGVDYYIWAVQISGMGTLLTAVNLFATVVKMRAPGMTWMRMPVLTWTFTCTNVLIMTTFPILTVSLALLSLDRYLGMHFFTNDMGGNQMLYVNLIWAWGHPEVYILVLPAFGLFSEIVPTYAKKPLFGYTTMVYATCAIMFLSGLVWVHHFFTMGAGGNVNAVFGIATMVIAIPTGVKLFNWLFTLYKGRVTFDAPMFWTMGFMVTFIIGGMTGVMLAIPPVDFLVHNSLFLVAHFHNTIIGGVFFGYAAGLAFYFPKVFGIKLNDTLGKAAFWFWFFGFYFAFMPLYVVGFMGMTRRMNHYDNPAWHPWMLLAGFGALLILCGIIFQLLQIGVSVYNRKKPGYVDVDGDPWNGRTLEWSTSSPPPVYNFAVIPTVKALDAFAYDKEHHIDTRSFGTNYQSIHMPKNTSVGFIIGVLAFVFGFAMVWYIWWLAAVSFIALGLAVIVRSFETDIDYYIPVDVVAKTEEQHKQQLMMGQAAE
ncbi:cytochrome o ubiquinol oxidase subunit I [Entomobacter blattae]|uniref:Ubiquinol oxidase subunit 1 n=1 Tax=Entomobacter blattae TaxID=2762277 RepID=A0A7H1NRY0_9PROT|nr:cytochrome o ubiquinol oxidase subunit I [Entomobacter blattae]QNT78540.1 Ubiquinol oxidase subunit 1 [Entomobacter blattae]